MNSTSLSDRVHRVGEAPSETSSAVPSIEVVSGSLLCRLRVWTVEEWAMLSERERPVESVHVPGLGWVGAVPVTSLN